MLNQGIAFAGGKKRCRDFGGGEIARQPEGEQQNAFNTQLSRAHQHQVPVERAGAQQLRNINQPQQAFPAVLAAMNAQN